MLLMVCFPLFESDCLFLFALVVALVDYSMPWRGDCGDGLANG